MTTPFVIFSCTLIALGVFLVFYALIFEPRRARQSAGGDSSDVLEFRDEKREEVFDLEISHFQNEPLALEPPPGMSADEPPVVAPEEHRPRNSVAAYFEVVKARFRAAQQERAAERLKAHNKQLAAKFTLPGVICLFPPESPPPEEAPVQSLGECAKGDEDCELYAKHCKAVTAEPENHTTALDLWVEDHLEGEAAPPEKKDPQ